MLCDLKNCLLLSAWHLFEMTHEHLTLYINKHMYSILVDILRNDFTNTQSLLLLRLSCEK